VRAVRWKAWQVNSNIEKKTDVVNVEKWRGWPAI
jgi:hypothetical protein